MNTNQEANGFHEFHCPHCTQSLEVSKELIGVSIDCPSCGESIEVPSPIIQANKSLITHTSPQVPSVIPTQQLHATIDSIQQASPSLLIKLRECLITIREKAGDLLVIAFDKKPSPSKIQKREQERAERKRARLADDEAELADMLAGKEASLAARKNNQERDDIEYEEILKGIRPPRNGFICESCGSVYRPVTQTQGSCLIELLLYVFFCLPGVIYTVWRLTSKQSVCGVCNGRPIPLATPRGSQLWLSFHKK